jgi:fumarate hydratase subunit beta
MTKNITTPLTRETINSLKCGDRVLIDGIIYTARDAAHKRLVEILDLGKGLPFDLNDQIIYYVGPCPAKPGRIIGSAGPTTSGRMDPYTPKLLKAGLKGMIGKGFRSQTVIDAIVKYGAVYFAAIGGAGALLAESIKEAEIVAFPELGPEAVYRLKVEKFPVTVVIDKEGNDLYRIGKEQYRKI